MVDLGGEVDGSVGAVLVDEVDGVGSCHGCERGGCENDSLDELHFDVSLYKELKDCWNDRTGSVRLVDSD